MKKVRRGEQGRPTLRIVAAMRCQPWVPQHFLQITALADFCGRAKRSSSSKARSLRFMAGTVPTRVNCLSRGKQLTPLGGSQECHRKCPSWEVAALSNCWMGLGLARSVYGILLWVFVDRFAPICNILQHGLAKTCTFSMVRGILKLESRLLQIHSGS